MIIQGVNVECNVADTQKIKAYELGQKELLRLANDPEVTKLMIYEQGELFCSAIAKLVTELFGEEACKQIITNPNDFILCIDVLKNVTDNLSVVFKEIENKLLKYDISRIQ